MKLSEKLNLNMEICYVPVAKLKDVQEMMANWKDNNKKIKIFSMLTAIAATISALYFVYEEETTMCLISFLTVFLSAVAGLFSSKSNRVVYWLPLVSLVVFSLVPAYFPTGIIRNFFMITVYIPAIMTNWFAYKALYNYKNVYIPLTKRKGFPNFVFSTADMYASKMYLKNKDDKTVAEKRVEASFNPFNEQHNVTDEETARMNSLRYEEFKALKEDLEKSEYIKDKEVKYTVDSNHQYKYGKSIFGYELVIEHDDIETCPKEDCRRFMRLWNEIKVDMFKSEIFMMTLLLLNLVFPIWSGSGVKCLLYFIPLITYIFGTNFIKLDQWWGVPVMLISLVAIGGTAYYMGGLLYLFTVVFFAITVLPRLVKWCCNYPVYKKLSKREGFPSFFETKVELYGDGYHIVEEIKPFKKRTNQEKLIINIGYEDEDEEVNKRLADFNYKAQNKGHSYQVENTAWNAFNYLEKDTENSAYDEFAIYEEINRKRREAELKEEIIKPNKDMGRKTNNED